MPPVFDILTPAEVQLLTSLSVPADPGLTTADVGKLLSLTNGQAKVYQLEPDVAATPVVWNYTATTISNIDVPAIPQVDAFADYVFPGQPNPEDTLAYVDGSSTLHDISVAGINFDIGPSISGTIDNAVAAINSSVQAYAEWVFPVEPIFGDTIVVTNTGLTSIIAVARLGIDTAIGPTIQNTIDNAVAYIGGNFVGGGGGIQSVARLTSPDRLRITIAPGNQGGADTIAGNAWHLGFMDQNLTAFQPTNPRINTNLVDSSNRFRNGHNQDGNIVASHLTSPERLRITLSVAGAAGNSWKLGFDPSQLGTFSGTNPRINTALLSGSNHFTNGVDGVAEIPATIFQYQDIPSGNIPGIPSFISPGIGVVAGINYTPGLTLTEDVANIAAAMQVVWVADNFAQSPIISHAGNSITITRGIAGNGLPPSPGGNVPPPPRGNFIKKDGSDLPFVEGTNEILPFANQLHLGKMLALVNGNAVVSGSIIEKGICSEAITTTPNSPATICGTNNGRFKNQVGANGDRVFGVALTSTTAAGQTFFYSRTNV